MTINLDAMPTTAAGTRQQITRNEHLLADIRRGIVTARHVGNPTAVKAFRRQEATVVSHTAGLCDHLITFPEALEVLADRLLGDVL